VQYNLTHHGSADMPCRWLRIWLSSKLGVAVVFYAFFLSFCLVQLLLKQTIRSKLRPLLFLPDSAGYQSVAAILLKSMPGVTDMMHSVRG